jgi:hypothetical protein
MVQFTDFSSNGRATGVLADTGYAMPAIEYMWTKYSDQLIAAARTYTGFATYERATENVLKTRVAVCFYCIFYYIHQYTLPKLHSVGTDSATTASQRPPFTVK